MSLRIIYGRAGSGKSHYCLNEIKSKIESGKQAPIVLLVPEQFTLQAERSLIDMLESPGIIKSEVLSFRRMAYRVFNETGGITYPHINSAGKCIIIHRILERMKNKISVLLKVIDKQGFVNTISEIITEFKRHNVTPEALNLVQENLPEGDMLKGKLKELSVIYEEFEKAVNESYRDVDDDLTMLVKKMDSTDRFTGAEIWIDGFSGFTPQEYEVIARLLAKAERVSICLCTDCLEDENQYDITDIFQTVKSVYNKLWKTALELGVKIETPIKLEDNPIYRFRDNEEAAHLEKYFFSFPYKRHQKKTRNISLLISTNIYSEIENTAHEIITLCRDKGLRYKDIAVVLRNLDEYYKLINVVFNEFGIPHFIDRKNDIKDHCVIRMITSMFDIFVSNWSYEAVFRYLKTGLTNVNMEETDLIENYVLACGIRGGIWTDEAFWNYRTKMSFDDYKKEDESSLLHLVNCIRNEIIKPLNAFRMKTRGKTGVRRFCSAVYEFMVELGIPQKVEKRINKFQADGEHGAANEYSQVWNIVMGVLDQIAEVMGDEKVGLKKFSDIFKIGIGEYKTGFIPPSLDQVLVGSVERTRSHSVKALFIIGVNDGVFPSGAENEGLLSDGDRTRLKEAGIEIASDTRTKAFEEQYMVYMSLTKAQKYLFISYPIADHEGRTLRPSIIVSRMKKIFPELMEKSDITNLTSEHETISRLNSLAPVFNEMIKAMRKNGDGTDIPDLWWDVFRWYSKNPQWEEKVHTAMKGLFYSNLVEPVSRDRINNLYGDTLYSSVSRLEKFSACPFSYYIQFGLGAKERRIYRLNPPDIGTFMHAVIERISGNIEMGGLSWKEADKKWCEEKVSVIINEMLKNVKGSVFGRSARYKSLAVRLKRVVSRAVWLIAQHIGRSCFTPVGYEINFGDVNSTYPPITIKLSSGREIKLQGRIDRVDMMETDEGKYLRIVDYKSGSKEFKLSDVYHGMQIQLITYLEALCRPDETGDGSAVSCLPAGMLYFSLDDPLVKNGAGLKEEEIELEIMKKLRMKGLLLADVKLIRNMDNEIDGNSLIIPARINKGDVLSKSSKVATLKQFNLLSMHVKKLLKEIGEEMVNGEIAIKPYKNKKTTSCDYCGYTAICQFDKILKDNKYRIINDMDDGQVWKMIGNEIGEGNGQ